MGIHAAHFSKQGPGAALIFRLVAGKFHPAIHNNMRPPHIFSLAAMLMSAHQFAAHAAGERPPLLLRMHVGLLRGDVHVNQALQNVEGGRAALTFMEEKLSLFEVAFHHSAFVEVEKISRDVLEDIQGHQIRGLAGRAGLEFVLHADCVGERARRAGIHALPARDAA